MGDLGGPAPGGYDVDSIKSYATLKKGLDDGSFVARRTKKVINCPVLDDRQYVTPSPLFYGIPRPRIELWYRTKQGSCFLSDGWLALADGPTEQANFIKANQDGRRLQMFDTISYTIGSGEGARTTIVAPVSKMYIPTAVRGHPGQPCPHPVALLERQRDGRHAPLQRR